MDDPWIKEHSPIAPEKLHALGVVNFRWNAADIGLKTLHVVLTGKRWSDAWPDVHNESSITLCKEITAAVLSDQYDQRVKDAAVRAVAIYDVCRINRNQLSHFLPNGQVGSDLTRLKGPTFDPKPFPDSIQDIRRIAEDIEALLNYLSAVINHLIALNYFPATEPPQLPDKPPAPTMLWNEPQPSPSPS